MTLPILAVFLSKFFTFSVLGLMFFHKAKHNVMWVLHHDEPGRKK